MRRSRGPTAASTVWRRGS
uniref:Rf2d n=1 Tax=Arundo donax TaxID=35708 RepID=A0A0A9C7C1_ARUDO